MACLINKHKQVRSPCFSKSHFSLLITAKCRLLRQFAEMQLSRMNFLSNSQWNFSLKFEGGPSRLENHKPILYIIGAGVGLYAAVKAFKGYKKNQQKKRWIAAGQDVVVLHQIQRGKLSPSISPFPLKLETYLRMAEIPYVCDFEEPLGPKGKTPWITINGQDIADSQLIMEYLARKFHKDFSNHLKEEERAVARAFHIMAEEHLYWSLALWRWVYDKGESLPKIQSFGALFRFVILLVSKKVKQSGTGQGIARHSAAEVIEMGIKDLRAISTYLGGKPFLMGDKPIEADCAIFGILAQMVWNTPNSPFEHLIHGELANLKDYCFRMKEKFWPDWDQCTFPSPA